MNKVMFFLFGFFLFALMLNLVSAETIIFRVESASNGQTPTTDEYSGSYMWTVPEEWIGKEAIVRVWGAGGGGSISTGSYNSAGFGGGGGGGYSEKRILFEPWDASGLFNDQRYAIYVGKGGPGGSSVGTDGRWSRFGNFGYPTSRYGDFALRAEGGKGGGGLKGTMNNAGQINYDGAVEYGKGGTASGGDVNYAGHTGEYQIMSGNFDPNANYDGGVSGDIANNLILCDTNQFNVYRNTARCKLGYQDNNPPIYMVVNGDDMVIRTAEGIEIIAPWNHKGYTPGNGGAPEQKDFNGFLTPTHNTVGADGGNGMVTITLLASDVPVTPPVVTTVSSCPVNQTIFSLYQSNNSHIALWNNESAGYKVCYNQIFGREYAVNNMRVCTGKNSVLNISSIDNAHAEKPYGLNYPVGICYGEMACSVRTARCNPGGEKIVARVSGETNAHVSNSSFSSYDNLLCCSEKPLGFNRLSWKDSGEVNFISNARNGDSVFLYAVTNFSAGTVVTFEIFEDDWGPDQEIRTGRNNLSGIVNESGVAKAYWTITQADIDAGDGLDVDDYLEFYYTANVNGFYNKISDELSTNKNKDTVIPANCDIEITNGPGKLNHRGIYFANKSIEFNQSRVSESAVSVQWVIEGENEARIVNNEKSFVMNFSRPGQKTIMLNANIPGCAEQSREVSILVTDGPGLFAYINAPFHKQVFKFTDDNIIVNYRGNESYVVNVLGNACSRTLTCLAGNCPTFTSNIPEGCSSPPNNLPVTTNGASDKFANLNFTWSKIKKGGEDILTRGHGEVNASGSTTYNRANHKSNAIGDKQIKLIANYTNISNGISLQNIFTRNFTLGTCINGGRERLTVVNGRVVNKSNTLNDRGACSDRSDGELTCCPFNHLCSQTSGLCEDSGETVESCSDYKDRRNCELDPFGVDQYEYRRKIGDAQCNIEYECVWNNNLCSFNTTELDKNGMFGGSCLESAMPVVDSSCDNGELTKLINITSTVSGELSCLTCQSGVFEVPCGRPSIELPFFGIQQIMLSLISIVGLYLVMFRKRDK
ncbi:MAG: hypothetical protein Q7R87_04000 [Nanoarchaeota archaeon]|nr:hypothetical protein [Nanoarchaeota archaeon]